FSPSRQADRPPPRPTLFPYTTLFRSHGHRILYSTTTNLQAAISYPRKLHEEKAKAQPLLGQLRVQLHHTDPRQLAKERLGSDVRSEEHTSELQSREKLVCRLLLEKNK